MEIPKLKGKQLLVFKEMLVDNGNETKAYMNVYKCKYETANKNAHKYMVKYGIREIFEDHIRQLAETVSNTKEIKLEEIIDNARLVIEKCKEQPEKIDKLNMLRANDQLAKIIGAFKQTSASEERRKVSEEMQDKRNEAEKQRRIEELLNEALRGERK